MEIEEEEKRLTARKLGCYCCCPEETPSRCQDFLKFRDTQSAQLRRIEYGLKMKSNGWFCIFLNARARTHTHNFPVPRKNHFEELSRFTLIRCRLIALHETETKTRRFKMVEKSFWFHKETQKDGQIREGGRKRERERCRQMKQRWKRKRGQMAQMVFVSAYVIRRCKECGIRRQCNYKCRLQKCHCTKSEETIENARPRSLNWTQEICAQTINNYEDALCVCFSPYFSFITNCPRPLNHPITVPFTESRAPINSQHFNWSLPSIKFCATINDKTFYQRVTSTQNREGRMDSTERFSR